MNFASRRIRTRAFGSRILVGAVSGEDTLSLVFPDGTLGVVEMDKDADTGRWSLTYEVHGTRRTLAKGSAGDVNRAFETLSRDVIRGRRGRLVEIGTLSAIGGVLIGALVSAIMLPMPPSMVAASIDPRGSRAAIDAAAVSDAVDGRHEPGPRSRRPGRGCFRSESAVHSGAARSRDLPVRRTGPARTGVSVGGPVRVARRPGHTVPGYRSDDHSPGAGVVRSPRAHCGCACGTGRTVPHGGSAAADTGNGHDAGPRSAARRGAALRRSRIRFLGYGFRSRGRSPRDFQVA